MKILIQFLTVTLCTTCLLSKAPALLINQLIGEVATAPEQKATNGPSAIALLKLAPAAAQETLRNNIKRILYDNDESAFQKALKAASATTASATDPQFAEKLAKVGTDRSAAKIVLRDMFEENGSAYQAMKAISTNEESAAKTAGACKTVINDLQTR